MIHNSQFTIKRLNPRFFGSIHYTARLRMTVSQFTVHNSRFTVHNSQFTVHSSQLKEIKPECFALLRMTKGRHSETDRINLSNEESRVQLLTLSSYLLVLSSYFLLNNAILAVSSNISAK